MADARAEEGRGASGGGNGEGGLVGLGGHEIADGAGEALLAGAAVPTGVEMSADAGSGGGLKLAIQGEQ